MPNRSFKEWLDSVPNTVKALSAVVTVLVPFIVPERLLPEQLRVIAFVTGLIIAVSLLCAWTWQLWLRKKLPWVSLTAVSLLIVLILSNIALVRSVHLDNTTTESYLIGFVRVENPTILYPSNLPDDELIRTAGPDLIPGIWGYSYYIAAIVYSLIFVLFIITTTLTIGTISGGGGGDKK